MQWRTLPCLRWLKEGQKVLLRRILSTDHPQAAVNPALSTGGSRQEGAVLQDIPQDGHSPRGQAQASSVLH